MNQIICKQNVELNNYTATKVKSRFFLNLSLISLISCILLTITYYIFLTNNLKEGEKFSKDIMDNLSLSKIYENSSEYESELLNQEIYFYENSSFSVIGIIDIEKIGISYPILSNIDKNLLKISPCRFYRTYAKWNRQFMYCRTQL